jgi:F0F1-type ATP synthase assembly protein I
MAAMLATVSDVAEAAPLGFVVGVVVGFILSDRFRIVRRNGEKT